MTQLNRSASEAMIEIGVTSATDITGFGLLGHLSEMLGEGLAASLEWGRIPLLDGAVRLAGEGILPGGSVRNREAVAG